MAIETANYINQLDPANPAGPDRLASGDDHIRMIKAALKATFPNLTGPMTLTQEFLNNAIGSSLVPFGVIQMWYGAANAVPTGYALCDGATVNKTDGSGTIVVPDMRGRVPVGATATRPTGSAFGAEARGISTDLGGAHTHGGNTEIAGAHGHAVAIDPTALTLAQIPAHTHFTAAPQAGGGPVATTNAIATAKTTAGDSNYDLQGAGVASVGLTSPSGNGASHTHTGAATAVSGHSHALTIADAPAHAHAIAFDVNQPSLALHFIMKV